MSRFAKFVVVHRWASAAALVVLAAVVLGIAGLMRADTKLPSAEVTRGLFVDNMPVRGEITAQRSIVMTAPSGVGQVQIISMAKTGDTVKAGDVVVRFDSTQLQNQLDTRSSDLKQAEREIDGDLAQAHMTEEQDATDLEKAKFDVERARLDASKQEILSQIDGEKAKLALADAEQALRQQEQKQKSNKAADAATVASARLKEQKAQFDVNLARRNIARMELKAPVGGIATVLTHWMGPGQQVEWRTGDNVWPGAGVMEIPDMNTIQVAARVDEIDRGRLQVGQKVKVRVDAIPDTDYSGEISEISPMAKSDFSGWPIVRNFDIRMKLDHPDNRLKPGMSASARIAVDTIKDAIMIPTSASFQKSGRTVAYVVHGRGYEERVIEVAKRSGDQLAVMRGLKPGERVYTKDPTLPEEAGKQ